MDVNNDGFLDLISLRPPAAGISPVSHYQNDRNSNHWLAVKCVGTTSGIVQELPNVAVDQYLTVTEPAKASMSRPGTLEILCWRGMTFSVEASSNLTTWTGLATLTNLNLTGKIQWTDPDASTESFRFYRAGLR